MLEYPYTEASVSINELLVINKHHYNASAVRKIKEIISEFLSKNLVYEDFGQDR